MATMKIQKSASEPVILERNRAKVTGFIIIFGAWGRCRIVSVGSLCALSRKAHFQPSFAVPSSSETVTAPNPEVCFGFIPPSSGENTKRIEPQRFVTGFFPVRASFASEGTRTKPKQNSNSHSYLSLTHNPTPPPHTSSQWRRSWRRGHLRLYTHRRNWRSGGGGLGGGPILRTGFGSPSSDSLQRPSR